MITFYFTPTMKCKKRFASTVLLASAMCLLGDGCKKSADSADSAVPVSVQAEKVDRKDITAYVSGDTVLTPQAESALVSKVSAPVQRFLVQRAAAVKKGQLLAVLDNADLAATVTDTKGSLTLAQAAYETSIKAQIPEDQKKAQLDVLSTNEQTRVAKAVLDSRKSLLDQGAIPRRDYDTAAAAYVQAKAASDIATQHLASLHAVSERASIQSAQGALLSAKGKYETAVAGLSFTELRSPIDGFVTDRPLFAGEMAQAGAPVLTIMDTSSLIAKVHVAQSQITGLKLGAPALVTIAGMSDPVSASVSLLSPALDPGSTTLEVWVKIPNKGNVLKAGTPAHVQIAVQTLNAVPSVPNESIVKTKEGEPAVMVVGTDGAAKNTPVKLGITDGKDTQLLSGVAVGAQVVTKGAYGLDDGTKVKVEAPGQPDADDAKPGADKGDEK